MTQVGFSARRVSHSAESTRCSLVLSAADPSLGVSRRPRAQIDPESASPRVLDEKRVLWARARHRGRRATRWPASARRTGQKHEAPRRTCRRGACKVERPDGLVWAFKSSAVRARHSCRRPRAGRLGEHPREQSCATSEDPGSAAGDPQPGGQALGAPERSWSTWVIFPGLTKFSHLPARSTRCI